MKGKKRWRIGSSRAHYSITTAVPSEDGYRQRGDLMNLLLDGNEQHWNLMLSQFTLGLLPALKSDCDVFTNYEFLCLIRRTY